MVAGEWWLYTLKIDTVNLGGDGWGTTRLYRNGSSWTTTPSAPPTLAPANGTAPLRIGTRDLASMFHGAIGKVAVYGDLSDARIAAHYAAMTTAPAPTPSYQEAVLADSPVAYFAVDGSSTNDLSGNGHSLSYPAGASTSTMPNGEPVAVFDGTTQYAQIEDAADLSVPNTGTLTVEVWVRPDTLDMPGAQSSGDGPMCHFVGKGDTSNLSQEYAFRFYNKTGSSRPNRFSAYHFPADGGLGAGSYFQGGANSTDGGTPPVLAAGDWVHVTAVYDTTTLVNGYGTVKIYRNGVLMDHDNMSDYSTTPVDGCHRCGSRPATSSRSSRAPSVRSRSTTTRSHNRASQRTTPR